MDSLLYGVLWWMAMSAVTALMWLPVFLYQRARDKKRYLPSIARERRVSFSSSEIIPREWRLSISASLFSSLGPPDAVVNLDTTLPMASPVFFPEPVGLSTMGSINVRFEGHAAQIIAISQLAPRNIGLVTPTIPMIHLYGFCLRKAMKPGNNSNAMMPATRKTPSATAKKPSMLTSLF